MPDAAPHHALLTDAFGRVEEVVRELVEGCSDEVLTFRPDGEANTIAWLVWHLARVQDDHVAGVAGTEQVWTAQGFAQRFDLPIDEGDIGYGHDADEVASVRASAELLAGYHAAVHRATTAYLDRLDADELERVVDESWDPPVTVSVRLVSVLSDCLQHAGQAGYVRGLAERAG